VLATALRYWYITRERDDTTQKSPGKAKLTSTEGYATYKGLGRKLTMWEVCLGFISSAMMPIA
jgi:hypothetical protein